MTLASRSIAPASTAVTLRERPAVAAAAAAGGGSGSGAGGVLQQRVDLLESANASLRRTVLRLQSEVATTRRLAYHDPLTGLPNRHLLRDRLEQGAMRASRDGTRVALVMLDLDQFKAVNDELGHEAGDRLLCEVAERLQSCTRGADTVCRYGGDEFIVMLPGVTGNQEVERVTQKIRACIAGQPFDLEGRNVRIGVSVGVAMLRPGDLGTEKLFRDADRAMYRAKFAARVGQSARAG